VDTAVERKKKVVVGQRVFVDFFDRADAAVHPFRAQTLARIMLDTGDIRRFSSVGNFGSYCRCVSSEKMSNGKRKGKGNTKNGNKYLSLRRLETIDEIARLSILAESAKKDGN
jgi:Transposase IS116/IS110/IS902 family